MPRRKPRDDSGQQRNKQQTPGTMLAGNNQGSPAGLLSWTDSITGLVHLFSTFGPGFGSCRFLRVQLKKDVALLILLGRRPIVRNRFVLRLLRLLHRNRARKQNVVL